VAGIIAAALIACVWLQASALENRFFDANGVRIRYLLRTFLGSRRRHRTRARRRSESSPESSERTTTAGIG
jgi:hypothetical protein